MEAIMIAIMEIMIIKLIVMIMITSFEIEATLFQILRS